MFHPMAENISQITFLIFFCVTMLAGMSFCQDLQKEDTPLKSR